MPPKTDYSPARARHQPRYRRNRDLCHGADTVKAAGERYLPKVDPDQSHDAYTAHLARTAFFPAAAKTLDGLHGLTFRKAPVLTAPDAFLPLAEYVTDDALTLNDLAEQVFDEALITNYCALLVDHPEQPPGLTLAQAVEGGFRPYISTYTAEAILDITFGLVRNRKVVVYARLADDQDTVRELSLDEGVYTVRVHRRQEGKWTTSINTPMRLGATMGEIPLVVVHDGNERSAPMDGIVDLNATHWVKSSFLSLAHYWLSAPVPVFTGLSKTDADDIDIKLGRFIALEDSAAKAEFLEYRGTGIQALERDLDRLEAHMRAIGLDMLGVDKAGVEAADTVAMRKAAEHSILAAQARLVGRRIQDALRWMWWWTGGDENEITFALNSDFLPTAMSPQELTALITAASGGWISRRTLFDTMVRGELIADGRTYEDEQDRIDGDLIDRPATIE